jgi:hypothetical protein
MSAKARVSMEDNDNDDDDDIYHDSNNSSDDESCYDSDDDIYHASNDGYDDNICDILNSNRYITGHKGVSHLGIKNNRMFNMKLVTSFMNDNNLPEGYDTTHVDFVRSNSIKDEFMNELNTPLPHDFLYNSLLKKITELNEKGEMYIVHCMPPAEITRLDKCSPFEDNDYRSYDGISKLSGEDSYAIDTKFFIQLLERDKNILQNADRLVFIQQIQRIVWEIINRGGGDKVKRVWPNKREWRRDNPTYDVKQNEADERKMSDKKHPPIPKSVFYFQGVVYFLTIHVPAEVVQYLTNLQLMEIYMFGVKVGESHMDLWLWWQKLKYILGFHPKLVAYWVCIGVPLGMNSWIIEQYTHFMHPLLHLNGEWWHRSILNFVPKILELFDTRIISLGRRTINELFENNNSSRTIGGRIGRIYAILPHVEDTLRTALKELMVNNKENRKLRQFVRLFLQGTKIGYTTQSNYKKRSHVYRYASAWPGGFDVAVSVRINNAYNVEQNVHKECVKKGLKIMGEMHYMVGGIEEAKKRIDRETKVESKIEFACRLLHLNYSLPFIKLILHLGLISTTDIKKFLGDKCYIVTAVDNDSGPIVE